jgi:hypothetical protein
MAYTNRIAAPALAGQGVLVTLDSTDSAALLPLLAVGTKATVGQNVGYVCRVDVMGNTFEVNPTTKAKYWESASTPGQLAVSATITIG